MKRVIAFTTLLLVFVAACSPATGDQPAEVGSDDGTITVYRSPS